MKIWKLNFELDEYDNLKFAKEFSIDEIRLFNGSSQKDHWQIKEVVRIEPGKRLELSDAPGLLPNLPVFSERAVRVLSRFLEDTSELLPLANNEKSFFAINIVKVLDCVDHEKSQYKLFRDGKRIMRFIKYSFDKSKIQGCHLFKIIDEPLGSPFVSDEFRELVIRSGLTGFVFKLVWNSEDEKVQMT